LRGSVGGIRRDEQLAVDRLRQQAGEFQLGRAGIARPEIQLKPAWKASGVTIELIRYKGLGFHQGTEVTGGHPQSLGDDRDQLDLVKELSEVEQENR